MSVTSQLCERIAATGYATLGASAIAAAQRLVLDGIAIAIAGTEEEAIHILAAHYREQGGAPQATAIGNGFRLNTVSAAALNGSTALIGADGDNSFQGAAYLFTQSNGSWSEGQKLTASDGLAGDEFGYRVALADNTLLVGAFTTTVGGVVSQGAAYVFTE